MNNFCKGGSELPIGKDSSCSKQTPLQKTKVHYRTLLKSYFTNSDFILLKQVYSIYKVLIQYCYSINKVLLSAYNKIKSQSLNCCSVVPAHRLQLFNTKAILLLGIALFHMFSLSAQTPRKESGVDGLLKIVSLGQKVPEDFWTKKHLFYSNGDTIRKSFEQYKGKLLVLDFWFSGCTKCLLHQKEISYFKQKYADSLVVVMVNSKNTRDNYEKIQHMTQQDWFRKLGITDFSSIIEDEYLSQILPSNGYPTYFWINNYGILQLITFRNLLNRNYQAPFIDKKR